MRATVLTIAGFHPLEDASENSRLPPGAASCASRERGEGAQDGERPHIQGAGELDAD